MKPTVVACVIVFNEERMLPGCLESVYEQVDRVVVVDGAYRLFPHTVPWSTDKTREIAWCYGAEWVPCKHDWAGRTWESQVEKRNAYLERVQVGEWVFVMDADVRVMGTLPVPEPGKVYAFQSNARTLRPVRVMRLFERTAGLHYEGSHNGLWDGGRLLNLQVLGRGRTPCARTGEMAEAMGGPEVVDVPPETCYFVNLAAWRDEKRIRDKESYLGRREPIERPYRRAHGI